MTDQHWVHIEPCPRRIRAEFGGETIADSTCVLTLRESGYRPVYYFPVADVAMELLEPTDHHTHCPWKGDASWWSMSAGGRAAENAAWGYRDPVPDAALLKGHLAFYWDRIDHWYEEDEEIFVHPRDPYVRVDAVASRRTVDVMHAGIKVASTNRALFVFETGLPTRYYIPPGDVQTDLLRESGTVTRCPYKGIATSLSLVADGRTHDDIAWVYRDPIAECPRIAGHVSFYNERVDSISVDGRPVECPRTQWSRD